MSENKNIRPLLNLNEQISFMLGYLSTSQYFRKIGNTFYLGFEIYMNN